MGRKHKTKYSPLKLFEYSETFSENLNDSSTQVNDAAPNFVQSTKASSSKDGKKLASDGRKSATASEIFCGQVGSSTEVNDAAAKFVQSTKASSSKDGKKLANDGRKSATASENFCGQVSTKNFKKNSNLNVEISNDSSTEGPKSSPSVSLTLGEYDSSDCDVDEVISRADTSKPLMRLKEIPATSNVVDKGCSIKTNVGFEVSDGDTRAGTLQPLNNTQGKSTADNVFDKLPQTNSAADMNRAWVNVVSNNRKPSEELKLQRFEHRKENGLLRLSENDVDELTDAIGFAIIGYIAGKFTGKQALLQLCNTWKVPYKIHLHGSGWLIFRFENDEDRSAVLNGGPYYIFGRQLMLKCMPRFFNFGDYKISEVPIWVQFPNLPIECWKKEALGKISSLLGSPLSTDQLSHTKERLTFARVLVEIDVSMELNKTIEFVLPDGEIHKQRVDYEFVPKFCASCRAIGHLSDKCRNNNSSGAAATNSGVNPNHQGKKQQCNSDGTQLRNGGIGAGLQKQKSSVEEVVKGAVLQQEKGAVGADFQHENGDRTQLQNGVVGAGLQKAKSREKAAVEADSQHESGDGMQLQNGVDGAALQHRKTSVEEADLQQSAANNLIVKGADLQLEKDAVGANLQQGNGRLGADLQQQKRRGTGAELKQKKGVEGSNLQQQDSSLEADLQQLKCRDKRADLLQQKGRRCVANLEQQSEKCNHTPSGAAAAIVETKSSDIRAEMRQNETQTKETSRKAKGINLRRPKKKKHGKNTEDLPDVEDGQLSDRFVSRLDSNCLSNLHL